MSGSTTIGVYDVGVALGAWDGTGLMVPEPNAWWLAAIGIACAAGGRSIHAEHTRLRLACTRKLIVETDLPLNLRWPIGHQSC